MYKMAFAKQNKHEKEKLRQNIFTTYNNVN